MFFLISKIGGTVLPNMTGTGLKCYPKRFTSHNNPLIVSVVYEKLKIQYVAPGDGDKVLSEKIHQPK